MRRLLRPRRGPDPQARGSTARIAELEARVAELEARLDHERLYPALWANRRVRDRFGDIVRAGPFAGLRYPDWAMTEVDLYSPKVLGSYERELHAAIEAAIAAAPRQVVDIGAAEGWYVVGLARRLPDARVLAFEPEDWRLAQLRPIAEHNGVADRIDLVEDVCTTERLAARMQDGALVICDCDGAEGDLLDPGAVPQLRTARLLIETHDLLVAGTTERLLATLGPTHEIERIAAEPRYVDDFPETDFMPLVTRQLAISEFRGGPQEWLVCVPRTV